MLGAHFQYNVLSATTMMLVVGEGVGAERASWGDVGSRRVPGGTPS